MLDVADMPGMRAECDGREGPEGMDNVPFGRSGGSSEDWCMGSTSGVEEDCSSLSVSSGE